MSDSNIQSTKTSSQPAAKPHGHAETTWALVPVKRLGSAKQRLEPRLGAHRRGLTLAMLEDVLTAVSDSTSISHMAVVTADQQVAELAGSMGAAVIPEDEVRGLNAAIEQGVGAIRANGGDRLVVLPADIPLVTGRELDRLLAEMDTGPASEANGPVGICASNDGGGTNFLCLGADLPFEPHYGPGSYHLHCAESSGLELAALTLRSRTVAIDIDQPTDLDEFLAYCQAFPACRKTETWRFLDHAGLAGERSPDEMKEIAGQLRDQGHGRELTYSRKVFIPLTRLCRDVCHYCTFATVPRHLPAAYMAADEAVELARQGHAMGCKEALFTLGEKPELRHAAAREALEAMGFGSTLEYVAHVAQRVMTETGLLPHINAGCMTPEEIEMLRPVSASMGIMLENVSERLCEKGQVHFGSPDKHPAVRLQTIADAGRARVPFTTGILIGIGETRQEILDSLLAIRDLHEQFGHIQEVIIQNFVPKADTKMAAVAPPSDEDLIRTIVMARVIFGAEMSIQAPPNLNPGRLQALVDAGINDWGGVSPLTPDHVNPESPWPHLDELARESAQAGKLLQERLTIYPRFIHAAERWLDPGSSKYVLRLADGQGLGREDGWLTGQSTEAPARFRLPAGIRDDAPPASRQIRGLLDTALASDRNLSTEETARLFTARGRDYEAVCLAADDLRREISGDAVSYVVNRNINYTNICTYRCGFCAFAKGRKRTPASDAPYLKSPEEIAGLTLEAWQRGATEVCLQGGIHPSFTGETYLEILDAVHSAVPNMHIHAFSPLEVTHGAHSMGLSLHDFLARLKEAGLKTLPGTAAEILADEIRDNICPDKINTAEWLEVVETAHGLGLPTTATVMFGHVDRYRHWAIHLHRVLELQRETGGFTEFVPLPFVADEAPIYRRGQARRGPTFRESVLMHAVSRLVLGRTIPNIQTSWVKMGLAGAEVCLQAGANDLGGTLMNESITRAAGALHGQEMTPATLRTVIAHLGRRAYQRNTLYRPLATADLFGLAYAS